MDIKKGHSNLSDLPLSYRLTDKKIRNLRIMIINLIIITFPFSPRGRLEREKPVPIFKSTNIFLKVLDFK